MSTGTLYVISAPSGGGKTSLVRALVNSMSNISVSISHTTRPSRRGEEDGVNYYFIDDAQFEKLVTEQAFVEHAEVFGYQYGTTKQWVDEALAGGVDVILEIDWQGARQIREHYPETKGIFILPPSKQALYQRLSDRAQDDESVIEARMWAATEEMSHYDEYEFIVVNDDFAEALADLQAIVKAGRLHITLQKERLSGIIKGLLAQ